MTFKTIALAASAAPFLLAAPVAAQSPMLMAPTPIAEAGVDLVIEIGLGGEVRPAFEGASDYALAPVPIIDLKYWNGPGWLKVDKSQKTAFSIAPSINVIGERIAADHAQLQGLDDRKMSVELGGRAGYEWEFGEVYVAARHAFGGGKGFVGEVGANVIVRPSQEFEFRVGPFLTAASSDYMASAFGVSAAEAVASGGRLAEYAPEGGIKSVGLNAEARYEFVPDTFLNVDASYSRLLGAAADSPIVQAGKEDQVRVGIGLSRQFSLDLY